MKKSLWTLFSLALIASVLLTACGGATQAPAATTAPSGGGEVYYLNF